MAGGAVSMPRSISASRARAEAGMPRIYTRSDCNTYPAGQRAWRLRDRPALWPFGGPGRPAGHTCAIRGPARPAAVGQLVRPFPRLAAGDSPPFAVLDAQSESGEARATGAATTR